MKRIIILAILIFAACGCVPKNPAPAGTAAAVAPATAPAPKADARLAAEKREQERLKKQEILKRIQARLEAVAITPQVVNRSGLPVPPAQELLAIEKGCRVDENAPDTATASCWIAASSKNPGKYRLSIAPQKLIFGYADPVTSFAPVATVEAVNASTLEPGQLFANKDLAVRLKTIEVSGDTAKFAVTITNKSKAAIRIDRMGYYVGSAIVTAGKKEILPPNSEQEITEDLNDPVFKTFPGFATKEQLAQNRLKLGVAIAYQKGSRIHSLFKNVTKPLSEFVK